MSDGQIHIHGNGIVRCGGQRIEGVELMEPVPPGGGKVSVKLTHPVVTDEDGKVGGIDMTVAENRRRHSNKLAGITEDDEKQLKGRLSNPKQKQHKAFIFDRHEERKGKRWKYEAKVGELPDPTQTHESPKFPLGSVMFVRGEEEDE
ncbi:MAG: hypothetical protein OXG83_07635 [Acidobacteria bacterium]|nr:hypothetical protein [Acidobacteriota bacterium]